MTGGVDEILAEPDRPAWLGTPRRRWVAGALVVAVAAALVSMKLASAQHSNRDAKPVAATTPPASVRVGPSPVDVTPGRQNFAVHDPAHCPATINCRAVPWVPNEVLATIREYVPNATIRSQTSVVQLHPNRLYFRQANASAKDVEVIVLVSQAARDPNPPTEDSAYPPGQVVRYVRNRTSDGYVVQVQYIGPAASSSPGLAEIRALAVDPRLRALG